MRLADGHTWIVQLRHSPADLGASHHDPAIHHRCGVRAMGGGSALAIDVIISYVTVIDLACSSLHFIFSPHLMLMPPVLALWPSVSSGFARAELGVLGSTLTDLGVVNSLGGAVFGSLIELIFPGSDGAWS